MREMYEGGVVGIHLYTITLVLECRRSFLAFLVQRVHHWLAEATHYKFLIPLHCYLNCHQSKQKQKQTKGLASIIFLRSWFKMNDTVVFCFYLHGQNWVSITFRFSVYEWNHLHLGGCSLAFCRCCCQSWFLYLGSSGCTSQSRRQTNTESVFNGYPPKTCDHKGK